MTRSARPSWRPRGAAGSWTNMPGATAMPIRAWCSMRWRGSRKRWRRRSSRRLRWSSTGFPQALTAIRGAVEKAQEARLSAPSICCGSRKISRRSARVPASSRRFPGAGARSAPTAASAISLIRKSDAIDAACTQLAETDPRVALRAAFEIIRSERSKPSATACRRRGARTAAARHAAAAANVVSVSIVDRPVEVHEIAESQAKSRAAVSEPESEVETSPPLRPPH